MKDEEREELRALAEMWRTRALPNLRAPRTTSRRLVADQQLRCSLELNALLTQLADA